MTKESIAQEVNTAREVVSRMLRQFADDRLIIEGYCHCMLYYKSNKE